MTYQVENRFQSLPFKRKLQRYNAYDRELEGNRQAMLQFLNDSYD
jgi:hypothetical protein